MFPSSLIETFVCKTCLLYKHEHSERVKNDSRLTALLTVQSDCQFQQAMTSSFNAKRNKCKPCLWKYSSLNERTNQSDCCRYLKLLVMCYENNSCGWVLRHINSSQQLVNSVSFTSHVTQRSSSLPALNNIYTDKTGKRFYHASLTPTCTVCDPLQTAKAFVKALL